MSETRKIAAILVADVVGYSKLAGADEDRTLSRLRGLRSDPIDPAIAAHRGRIVKRTGDGSIIEFRSVVDAVRCAIEVQSGLVDRNAGVQPDRRIEFRIGIHLGDVVEEADGDLMGDGVNIAARIEGIAAPGAIFLSEDAYRQVKGRVDLAVSDIGPTQLKNIADPIRVYSLDVGEISQVRPAPAPTPEKSVPPRLSMVVLPFANIGGDPSHEHFVDGVTESLTTDLSRIRGAVVIARNTAFTYKAKTLDVKTIGRELSIRYVLEGSVQRGGNRMRVNVQLIDAESGNHLWAERFDNPLGSLRLGALTSVPKAKNQPCAKRLLSVRRCVSVLDAAGECAIAAWNGARNDAALNDQATRTHTTMAKTIGRLTHQLVGSVALEPGLYGDGGNLYLRVGKDVVGEYGVVKDGGRSWVFVYRYNGKQRELGLGRAGKRKGAVSLADARATAKQGRALLDRQPSVDPRTVWRAQPKTSVRTFGQAAKDYIAEKELGWKNAKHISQWVHTVKVYCQSLADTPVDQIGVEDVRSILTPIWQRAPETASRVRVRIAAVIDHAMPIDSMQPNPARLLAKRFAKVKEAGKFIKGAKGVLERVERGNFAALPHRDAPAFVKRLRDETSVAARGLEFLLLTASRTSEVIGAKWSEIVDAAGLWTIPPERLKVGKRTRRSHVVPLSPRALAILEEMREIRVSDFIFPGRFDYAPLHDLALLEVVKRLEPAQTAHGLRSTFRDWVGEETDFAGELAELALGHVVKGVEGRYRRGTAIDRRRALMDAWSNFLDGAPRADNVLPFARSA